MQNARGSSPCKGHAATLHLRHSTNHKGAIAFETVVSHLAALLVCYAPLPRRQHCEAPFISRAATHLDKAACCMHAVPVPGSAHRHALDAGAPKAFATAPRHRTSWNTLPTCPSRAGRNPQGTDGHCKDVLAAYRAPPAGKACRHALRTWPLLSRASACHLCRTMSSNQSTFLAMVPAHSPRAGLQHTRAG